MSELERFGVSMEEGLLRKFDSIIDKRGYRSRSEAIRDLVRKEIINSEWENPKAEVIGTISLVYAHDAHDLAVPFAKIRHEHQDTIVCSTHVHLDEHNSLEVIVVRGCSLAVKKIADALITARGVKHGELVCTTTGRKLM